MKWLKRLLSGETDESVIYESRKQEFIRHLDTRQHILHKKLQGASWTEVVLGLEERVFQLEAKIQELEREAVKLRAPVLTDVVEAAPIAVVTEPVAEVAPVVKPKRVRAPRKPKTPTIQ